MHHKRGRVKSSRAGCLMCKPHKHQGAKDTFANQTRQEQGAIVAERPERTPSSAQYKPSKFSLETRRTTNFAGPYWKAQQEWHVYRWYATERARDEALRALSRKPTLRYSQAVRQCFPTTETEYRVGPTR